MCTLRARQVERYNLDVKVIYRMAQCVAHNRDHMLMWSPGVQRRTYVVERTRATQGRSTQLHEPASIVRRRALDTSEGSYAQGKPYPF